MSDHIRKYMRKVGDSPNHSNELTTLRSQVERLTGERDELLKEMEKVVDAHNKLMSERDQALAACAVMREALDKLFVHANEFSKDWHNGDFRLPTLAQHDMASMESQFKAAQQALSTTCGNEILERLIEARGLLGGARDSMNVVAECGPCECHLHRELCIVCDCENKVKSTDTWLKGTP